jgi:elongation of very long chain fatty acids protein 6
LITARTELQKMEAPQSLINFLYASTNFLTFSFEKNFRPEASIAFAKNHPVLPISLVVGYICFIYFGSKVMESRKPFGLQLALAGWNALLSFFSFVGMCRTVPYLLASILSNPYESTVCTSPLLTWGNGPTGFWVMLFIFSKVPELVDTVFIVLRKKPLIFLHWYHHVTVLLFCWNAYATIAGSGLYFVAMNYTVHALMYGYYCLQALHMCPKSFPAILITLSQIAQMFVGTGVCMSAWYFMLNGRTCANDISNLIAGGAMYGSYLYLFCDFAFRRYSKKAVKKVEKTL